MKTNAGSEASSVVIARSEATKQSRQKCSKKNSIVWIASHTLAMTNYYEKQQFMRRRFYDVFYKTDL